MLLDEQTSPRHHEEVSPSAAQRMPPPMALSMVRRRRNLHMFKGVMSTCQWLAEVIWWAQGTRQPRASGIAARTWRRRLVVRRRGVLTGVSL